jgi:hypothetical protein
VAHVKASAVQRRNSWGGHNAAEEPEIPLRFYGGVGIKR